MFSLTIRLDAQPEVYAKTGVALGNLAVETLPTLRETSA
jgi:hypothetical protein